MRPPAWSRRKVNASSPRSPTSAIARHFPAAIDRGVAELGHLDVVMANAGICPLTAGLPPQAFADAVDVDLGGVLNLVHASLKHLEAGASIIVIGSNAAFMSSMNTTGIDGGPGGAGYAFAKSLQRTMSTTSPARWHRSPSG